MKKSPVVHFEMPAEDKKRMSEFYGTVFGWQVQHLRPEMGDYAVVTTTELDENSRFPKTPGQINGGFYQKTDDAYGKTPRVVIAVDDIKESMKKVTDAGGNVLTGPDTIPGIGQYALFQDSEGNVVGMLQPFPM